MLNMFNDRVNIFLLIYLDKIKYRITKHIFTFNLKTYLLSINVF